MMIAHTCEHCRLRARFDAKPASLLGRFWRWHANWCPGWRRYMRSLPAEQRAQLATRYNMPDKFPD